MSENEKREEVESPDSKVGQERDISTIAPDPTQSSM
jgi:hypothetical protein